MPTFRLDTPVGVEAERCFRLALSVDAHTASMGASNERAVAGRTSGMLGPGDVVTWQARHFGLPFRMTVKITEHRAPQEFVDVQVRGPFAHWHHRHLFEPSPDGGTLMRDEIDFRSPLGVLGRLVDRLVLERYLRRLVARRNAWLKSTLEATPEA